MEFPDLGKHCSKSDCKQLDFLPVKCDACQKIFCHGHFRYEDHNCPESYRKDNQVPVCPLCNCPIPVKKGQQPDLIVGQHIDNDCKLKKKSSNKCNVKGCKVKELIPVVCDKCGRNFCLRHRLAEDHQCTGTGSANEKGRNVRNYDRLMGGASKSKAQASASRAPSRPSGPSVSTTNAGMSEDEALARAMAMSMADTPAQAQAQASSDPSKLAQEEQDAALARALQQEEVTRNPNANRPPAATRQSSRSEKSCQIS